MSNRRPWSLRDEHRHHLTQDSWNFIFAEHIRKAKLLGAAAMSDDLHVLIGYQVEDCASWRWNKVEQFPNDPRNRKAAEELERLALDIEKLEGSEIHKRVRDTTDRLVAVDNGDIWYEVGEDVSAELRSIGFRSGYETGEQLLAWYCDLLEEHRRVVEDNLSEIDHSVHVTETGLSEEVANHPAVKAAAQAYAEAVARASVEARKKNL
jgi:hypothetical protein